MHMTEHLLKRPLTESKYSTAFRDCLKHMGLSRVACVLCFNVAVVAHLHGSHKHLWKGQAWEHHHADSKPAVIPVPVCRVYLVHLGMPPSVWNQRLAVVLVTAAYQLELKQSFIFKK